MKKIMLLLCCLVMLCSLAGCQPKLVGEAALIQKAREEFPISDAENTEIQYAGMVEREDSTLHWFISGNEYQAHSFLPMECKPVGEDSFTYVRTYKPLDRGDDIVVLQWKGGYSFLIYNPDCRTVVTTDEKGQEEITVEQCPYVFYRKTIPSEYRFYDAHGEEIL